MITLDLSSVYEANNSNSLINIDMVAAQMTPNINIENSDTGMGPFKLLYLPHVNTNNYIFTGWLYLSKEEFEFNVGMNLRCTIHIQNMVNNGIGVVVDINGVKTDFPSGRNNFQSEYVTFPTLHRDQAFDYTFKCTVSY